MTDTKEIVVMENSDNKKIVTISSEVENVEETAREDASFEAFLSFKKGEYVVDEKEVPVGTEYLAHPEAWLKVWRKYDGEKVVERHVYRTAKREKPQVREDLDDWPGTEGWPIGDDGKPYDPWALLYLVPFENAETGDMVVFSTRSIGGRRAVADLAVAWARRCKKIKNCGSPKIRLAVTSMPSKKWGPVKRPLFQIVDWEDREPARITPPGGDDFNDSATIETSYATENLADGVEEVASTAEGTS
jgi:hypothetical protein